MTDEEMKNMDKSDDKSMDMDKKAPEKVKNEESEMKCAPGKCGK